MIKNLFKDKLALILTLCLVAAFVLIIIEDYLPLNKWSGEARPCTDKFMQILKSEDFDAIYNDYVDKSSINYAEFINRIEELRKVVGKIKSFRYQKSTFSKNKNGKIINYLLIYKAGFTNGEKYQCVFYPDVDKEKNEPIPCSLEKFKINVFIKGHQRFALQLK